jgi:phage/plasmid-associated DNA primase
MFLIGRGRNGKGVYEYVLQCLYARTSFSFIGLEEINRSNFAKAFLIGKRGLIVSEVGDDSKRSKGFIPTHFLKLASGDGFIDSDRKNTTRIQFPPAFKATIDTNDMPTIADTSRGWAERFCKADLPYHFVDNPDTDNPREKKKDPHLKAKLTTPEELSGILNLIIYRAMEICKTETIIKRSGSEMVAEYQVQSGSVKAFLEKYCEYVPYLNGALVEAGWYLDEIYQAYSDWCTHPGINADKVDDKRFGSSVKKFCSGAHSTKERVGAKQRRKYRGLMFFKENYEKDMESLSAPLVPLNSFNVPLKSITAPLVPLNDNIWISIREKFSLSSIEKNVEKRPFNGYNGAPIDSNGAIKIVNGSQMEPTAKFNGTASSDAPTRKKRKSPLDF